jgi:DNA ligase 1
MPPRSNAFLLQILNSKLITHGALPLHPRPFAVGLPTSNGVHHLAVMPPKQANIGYVRPSQTTLGCDEYLAISMYDTSRTTDIRGRKFFGANGTAPKTQSKLSFSTKPKPKSKDEESKEELDFPDEKPTAEDTEDAEEGAAINEEANGDTMEVDSDAAPSETGKKRPIKDEETDSEDEPPSKRQRSKTSTKESKNPVAKPTKKAKDPPSKPEKPRKTQKAIVLKAEEASDTDDNDASAEQVKSSKKAVSPAVESSPIDDEEVLSSEEESQEAKAKAREKVQTTLKAKSKDPYPDWKPGEPVPYAALCTTFSKIEMTTKRLEILAHCSLFLRQVLRLTPQDLLPTILLMINKLAADYAGIELGIGESLIMKAISESTGRSLAHIKADQNDIGDLGLVAAKSRSKQPTMFKPKALTVQGVHKGLMAIATVEGQGAQGRKVDGIKKLLSAADAHSAGKAVDITQNKGGPSEAKYIVRTLEGKLRLGLAEKTVLVALSQAMIFHEMEQKGKTPSTSDLASSESTLKSVYRFVKQTLCLTKLTFPASYQAMKSSSLKC